MPEEMTGGWLGSEGWLTPYLPQSSRLTHPYERVEDAGALGSVKGNIKEILKKVFDKTAVSPYNCPVP